MSEFRQAFEERMRKQIERARKYSPHPVFDRPDIEQLAQFAFLDNPELYERDLSAQDIDALFFGLNIAQDFY